MLYCNYHIYVEVKMRGFWIQTKKNDISRGRYRLSFLLLYHPYFSHIGSHSISYRHRFPDGIFKRRTRFHDHPVNTWFYTRNHEGASYYVRFQCI